MTYRQKLLFKRILVILGILVLAVILALILGFSYLGRYVVYTEDGAHFSFHQQEDTSLTAQAPITVPESPVLVTGDSIWEDFALREELEKPLEDYEVNGLMVDYATLSDGTTLNEIDFTETDYNTLVLELRVEGSSILHSDAVDTLMRRAKGQGVKLIAMMSCLDDSEYALAHQSEALPIEGGALWMSSSGNYWLDPSVSAVQSHIIDLIMELIDMGFSEVILNNFYFPESESIVYDTGDQTRGDIAAQAFQNIQEKLDGRCILGLFVPNAQEGHQAFHLAEHLYVFMSSGGSVNQFDQTNEGRYIVYITDSHDTRFENYGKLQTQRDADFVPEQTE